MAERPIVAELRAVDAALAPLAPSRGLDSRIDALLAGRAHRLAPRRVMVGALGACAVVAAVTLWLGRAGDDAVALGRVPEAQHSPLLEESRALDRSPGFGGGASRRPVQEREGAAGLALVDGATPVDPPPALSASARTVGLELPMAREAAAPDDAASRPDVRRAAVGNGALVARGLGATDDAVLEAALAALRADKARGDLTGAVLRVDGLLAAGVGERATAILRIERARLQERLGDRVAACAGLVGLRGDDARDARLRLSCP